MIGDLSIAQRAFQQSSNSVEVQLVEARLALAAASGKDVATAPSDPPDAPSDRQLPVRALLTVKVLDRKA